MPEDDAPKLSSHESGIGNGAPAPDEATITQADALDMLLDDDDLTEDLVDQSDAVDGDVDLDGATAPLSTDPADLFQDVDDLEDEDTLEEAGGDRLGEPIPAVPVTDSSTAARLARLEAAAGELAQAERTREARRTRRKVVAATTGAGASGFVPLLLQLLGVYDLDPAVAATLSTVASLIGAFAAGWVTPERTPPLPDESVQALLRLGSPDQLA
jgi:hypothetical protein